MPGGPPQPRFRRLAVRDGEVDKLKPQDIDEGRHHGVVVAEDQSDIFKVHRGIPACVSDGRAGDAWHFTPA